MNKSFSQLVKERYSCRSFSRKPLTESAISSLTGLSRELTENNPHGSAFQLLNRQNLISENMFQKGTYGMIKNPRYYITGVIHAKTADVWLDFGYNMEHLVMRATELGVQSCWIGGVFDRKTFSRALKLQKNSLVPAVIALGYAQKQPTVRDRLVRWSARGNTRKKAEQIFSAESGIPLSTSLNEKYSLALENLRLAPSASNRQPWRILRQENRFDFFLERTPAYKSLIPQVDLQMIDMGIALYHFTATLAEEDVEFSKITVPLEKISCLFSSGEYLFSVLTKEK